MNNTQKLYLMEKNLSVLFLSSDEPETLGVKKDGLSFLKEEIEWNGLDCGEPVKLSHITTEDEIPSIWLGALIYGTEDEITALDFLKRTNDPEYQLYCSLKKKYEGK